MPQRKKYASAIQSSNKENSKSFASVRKFIGKRAIDYSNYCSGKGKTSAIRRPVTKKSDKQQKLENDKYTKGKYLVSKFRGYMFLYYFCFDILLKSKLEFSYRNRPNLG